MERDDVLVTLTKLQDGNLPTRVIPEKSHITGEALSVRMPLATLHHTVVATAQHPDLILMILTAYCVPVVLSVHTL